MTFPIDFCENAWFFAAADAVKAKRIWEVLKEEGFTGGYTIVKDVVRQIKRAMKQVYMPLIHRPGEAQVDFGHALVKMFAPKL